MVSRLRIYWRDPEFRDAIKTLLALSPDDMALLRAQTESSFEGSPNLTTAFKLEPAAVDLAIAALRSLYEQLREEGRKPQELLDELETLAHSTDGDEIAKAVHDKKDALTNLLGTRQGYERSQQADAVVRAPLPVLEQLGLFVDLRLVQESEGDSKLVPVILARLSFDEPVAGTSNAVTFQIPNESIEPIRNRLESIMKTLDDIRSRYRDQLL